MVKFNKIFGRNAYYFIFIQKEAYFLNIYHLLFIIQKKKYTKYFFGGKTTVFFIALTKIFFIVNSPLRFIQKAKKSPVFRLLQFVFLLVILFSHKKGARAMSTKKRVILYSEIRSFYQCIYHYLLFRENGQLVLSIEESKDEKIIFRSTIEDPGYSEETCLAFMMTLADTITSPKQLKELYEENDLNTFS